jgi:inactivated superfamily I helicase
LTEALWLLLDGRDFTDDIIFLPSRRAIRSVEKFIADKTGAAILPKLVALGEEVEDESTEHRAQSTDIISNQERIIVLAQMLSAASTRRISDMLPVAKDLVRMQDYLENEQIANSKDQIDWMSLIDEKYAEHFQKKAEFLSLADSVMQTIFPNKITAAQKRNQDIRDWINVLGQRAEGIGQKVIVCGSTASVPATADLMEFIASLSNGYIILPGKLPTTNYHVPTTNPYYSEMKFLERINFSPENVQIIDAGESNIDFFNDCFDNSTNNESRMTNGDARIARIDCDREADEAAVAAELAARAIAANKSVLIITPDAAGGQRLKESLEQSGIKADFSGGESGAQVLLGRMILNKLDELSAYSPQPSAHGIFDLINSFDLEFADDDLPIIEKIKEVSEILKRNGIAPDLTDARAILADALSSVQIRPAQDDSAKARVLGTAEARMQTADVVILTGLNEGMFPALGYENPWLPRAVSEQIGLPPPERKVSLQAMDFITLSCGPEVYWLRSKTAGGSQTTESRFLSRVSIKHDIENRESRIENRKSEVSPLDYSFPRLPADRSDIFVTDLELLIHNPYAFYCRHILRLKPRDDWWAEPGAKEFGTLVHEVIEHRAQSIEHRETIIEKLDEKAKEIIPKDSVLFQFWHKRFVEMAPAIEALLKEGRRTKDEGRRFGIEENLETTIAGRRVRARADMIIDNTIIDIKTGAAPNRRQLSLGNMPQLPLEAHMLESGNAIIRFLQLQNNNIKLIEYSGDDLQTMIEASVQKASELFGRYSKDYEEYEYRETTGAKYKAYDDLARIKD